MNQNLAEANRLREIIFETLTDKNISNNIFSKILNDLDLLLDDKTSQIVEIELKLEKIAFEFRQIWLQYSTKVSSNYYRSPYYEEKIELPNSKSISYDYERVASTRRLDERCLKNCTELEYWDSDCTFFSSGMSAIHVVLSQLFIYIRQSGIEIPRVSAEKGLYFETIALFRFLKREGGFYINYLLFEDILANITAGTTDIVIIEPVLCNMRQSVLDLDLLIASIQKRDSERVLFIIIDSSITGLAFEMQYLLNKLTIEKNIVFIDVQSGLKLYQEGLEFTSVGFSKIYTLKSKYLENSDKFRYSAQKIKKQLGRLRKVYGVGLTLEQFSILDANWFLNVKYAKEYMNTIHDNNLYVAQKLKPFQGIFEEIFHPCLSKLSYKEWAQSPFIILTFHEDEDNQKNMDILKEIILYEIGEKNITLYWGTSFGFRHHRFEIIKLSNEHYDSGKDRHIIRLCIGYRKGYSLKQTLHIFLKIARYKTFKQLAYHYNHILNIT